MKFNGWLLLRFIHREITSRFVGSLLGGAWILLHPLALLLIYSFVFTNILKVRAPADAAASYTVLLALCLWPWMAFQEAVSKGAQSVTANAALINKVPFAHELVVLASVTAAFVVQWLGYIAVLGALAIMGHPIRWAGLPLALFAAASLALLALGLGLGLGALQVFIRDIEQALPPALAMLFYMSPVLYTISMVPPGLQEVISHNPVGVLLEATRQAWLDGRHTPNAAEWASGAACVAAAGAGAWMFRRLSPHFEEAL